MYNKPFHITDNIGNNAFSFDKRKNPSLFVTDIRDGGIDDVQVGNKIVFEDFDENGELKSCVGLKHFIHFPHPTTGKPIVVVDNHNHVFYFWHEARKNGIIGNGATLIHIDQHKDTREPSLYLSKSDSEDLKKVFDYTNFVVNVGNYILPAVRDGLVGEVVQINGTPVSESGQSIAHFQSGKSIILNIDLDFWSPEMDYVKSDLKNRVTKELMARADFITIATSPFFIEQERAIGVFRTLFS
jgi:hypothetical protein